MKKKAKKVTKKLPKKKAKKITKKKAFKKTVKKSVKKAVKKVKEEKPIGVITHFYTHIKVAVIKFKTTFKTGGEVHFKGATTDFKQKLASIQYDHKPVATAKKGQGVGVKVAKRVRDGDLVFLVK